MLTELEVGRSDLSAKLVKFDVIVTSAEKEDIFGNLRCIPQVLNSYFFTPILFSCI